jgi:hypothetical protein
MPPLPMTARMPYCSMSRPGGLLRMLVVGPAALTTHLRGFLHHDRAAMVDDTVLQVDRRLAAIVKDFAPHRAR